MALLLQNYSETLHYLCQLTSLVIIAVVYIYYTNVFVYHYYVISVSLTSLVSFPLLLLGHQVAMWPINSIRRYGVNNVCFTFETGR